MVLISLMDSILINFMQFKMSLDYYELEGCFYPKKFTTWEEFAKETRLMMAREFDLKILPGSFKDKIQMEKEVTPLKFEY